MSFVNFNEMEASVEEGVCLEFFLLMLDLRLHRILLRLNLLIIEQTKGEPDGKEKAAA